MKKKYLPLEPLALILGLPQNYLRALADSGKIPSLNVNGRLRFDESEVRSALIQLSKTESGKEGTQ